MSFLPRTILSIVLLAGIAAALVMTPVASPAEARSADTYAIGDRVEVITDALNVRSGPGLGERILDVVTSGTGGTVTDNPVEADDYLWYEVDFDSGSGGWVAGAYLTAADGGFTGYARGTEVVVDTDWLNLRSGAGMTAAVIDVLPFGTHAIVRGYPASGTGDGRDWYQIELFDGTVGWVAGEYLAAVGERASRFEIGDAVVVATDWLNLRDGEGLSAGVIDVLPYGTEAVVRGLPGSGSGDGFDWYRIELDDGTTGWVAGAYLAPA